jgi:hypothetical protein
MNGGDEAWVSIWKEEDDSYFKAYVGAFTTLSRTRFDPGT